MQKAEEQDWIKQEREARKLQQEINEMKLHLAARDEGARHVLFFSDVIYSGNYLESLALFLWRVL